MIDKKNLYVIMNIPKGYNVIMYMGLMLNKSVKTINLCRKGEVYEKR